MARKQANTILFIVSDALFINLAFALSYLIRYQMEIPYPVDPQYYASFRPYIPFAIFLTTLSLIMFWIDGLYRFRKRHWYSQLYHIINGTTTSIVIIMAVTFFLQPLVYSRGMLVLAGVIIIIFLSMTRATNAFITYQRKKRGIGISNVIVVGAGEVGRAVIRTILADPMLGIRVAGYLDDDPSKGNGLGRIKSLGTIEALEEAIRKTGASEVIITLPWMYHRRIMQLVETCERENVIVRVVPDVFQRSMQNIDLDTLSGIPLMSPSVKHIEGWEHAAKRGMDILISVTAFIPFALIYLVAAVMIKLDSRGKIIFEQQRVGKDGKPITVFKFRTMIEGAEQMKQDVAHLSKYRGDNLLKIPDDPRMTRVGKILRKTSIDELPQIINVLKGEMSWIGPRPNTPDEVTNYQPWHHKRLSVLPGITGLWQVSGRSNVPFDEMCLLDIFYIENWSLGLDIRILLQTIPHVLFGEGAY